MADNPEFIEDEIERIRERIDARLDTLSNEFTPRRLLEGVTGNKDMLNADTLKATVSKAKDNPLATALIGVGLFGLFLSSRNSEETSNGRRNQHLQASPAADLGKGLGELRSQVDDSLDAVSSTAADVKSKAMGTAEASRQAMSEAAEQALDNTRDAFDKASSTLSEKFDSTAERLSDAATSAQNAARRAPVHARAQAEGAVDWVKENPVPAGLMALAAGAAISSFFTTKSSTSRLEASRELHEEARSPVAVSDKKSVKRTSKRKVAAKPKASSRIKASAAPTAPSKSKKANLSSSVTAPKNPKSKVTTTQPLVSTRNKKGATSIVRSADRGRGTSSGTKPDH